MPGTVIKVRHKSKIERQQCRKSIGNLPLAFLVLATIAGNFHLTNAICDKSPDKSVTLMPKQSGNGGFAIGIVGSPQFYRPGQQYEITLEGISEDPEDVPQFTNFMLAAEAVSTNPNHQTPLGIITVKNGDPMVMYSGRCRNSIKESSSSMKSQISVTWTAPNDEELKISPPGSSGCIDFRAMVIRRQDYWYMNDGSLTYRICRDTSFVDPSAGQDDIPLCTACKEAKYELIFEGIWSRHTHPKDFPVDEWRTQFSKIIGASHSNPIAVRNGRGQQRNRYRLWDYGTQASEELAYLAKYGMTRRLEAQMKLFSPDIRSVIKARGLEQRSNVAGQTFAVFRVDATHHLLSFVTKMIPSPDWIVGVSNENLCLPNGSWTDHRTIDLYPADAGVDSGMTYLNPREQPTYPQDVVQRITSSNPDNDSSPFWDEHRTPMKPVARLHLIKQREYEKRCPQGGRFGNGGAVGNPSIGMYNSGVPGGSGDSEDPYVVQQGPGMGPGEIPNEESYAEYGSNDNPYNDPSSVSDYGSDQYGSLDQEDPCMTTDWSVWSQCSHTCGKNGNSQSRWRNWMHPSKALSQAPKCSQQLNQKQPCRHLEECPPKSYEPRYINVFPDTRDNNDNFNDYSSQWSQVGLSSRNLMKPSVPGNRPSYVYSGPNENIDSGNQDNQWGTKQFGYYQQSRNTNRNRGNQRQGMYGPRVRYPANNDYRRQYASYQYGGGDGRNNNANQISDLPEQARYHSRPQGDGSSPSSEPSCGVSDWGEWSECSSICDSGLRTRNRKYNNDGDMSGGCSEELSEHESCMGDGPDCPQRYPANVNSMGFGGYPSFNREVDETPEISEDCATADWSEWSPCSSKCSQGNQKRTRLYTKPFVKGPRSCDVALIESQPCWGDEPCSSIYDQTNYRNDQNYIEFDAPEEDIPMYPDIATSDMDKCTQELNEGDSRCISHYIRWYYDSVAGECKEFRFTGCGGNQNNFKSKDLCMGTCSEEEEVNGAVDNDQDVEINTRRIIDHESDNNGLVSENLIRLTPEEEDSGVFSPPRTGLPPKPVDCQATAWSEWTTCSKSCGTGWTTRDREILVEAGPQGRPCPKKLHRKRKCRPMPCPADTKYWYQGSWRHIGQN